MSDAQIIVQKLWNYCNVLRDDGLSYGDYVEQLTFLLFLKMADERLQQSGGNERIVPEDYDWQSLKNLDGPELDDHYRKTLEALSKSSDERLRVIFSKAQNKVQDPAKLRRLIVDLIDKENWSSLDSDVKGDAYEGLLQKNAEDTKGGAGQYFTPRPLIQAIVDVMQPGPEDTICDPACGTGGFLLAVHNYVYTHHRKMMSGEERQRFDTEHLRGYELVDSVVRLGLMNMALHGIGSGTNIPIVRKDSLDKVPDEHFKVVLTNPPFGKKSAVTFVTKEEKQDKKDLTTVRTDFWASTANKQLNFLQHVYTMLEIEGRAAVVLPDNVLFEGGAGKTIRENLLRICDVHTLLRLPTGLFYAQGVKANVLFFDRKPAREDAWTERLWIYDFRTNQNFTLKERPLKRSDLNEFVECFNPGNRFDRKPTWSEENPKGRWRDYTYEQLTQRDKINLDIFWVPDDSLNDNLEEPDVIASRMFENLQLAMRRINLIMNDMQEDSK
ncbi:MAG: putative type I restriction enzymeP M protein [Gammaproteobacteria bacterium]|nr:putative type I restriction enzymeP M protein [Gammaproteobacteria bacterium]